jgi:hypothetical protein
MKIINILLDNSSVSSFSALNIIIILLSVFAALSIIFISSLVVHSVIAASNPVNGPIANHGLKINVHDKRIAFIEPTFTYAAYRNGSFYNFYNLYSPTVYKDLYALITTDINLLKNRPIPHGPFPYYAHPNYLDIPYINYFNTIYQHVKKNSDHITNFTDVDVHEGKIFQQDGSNAYDILFLFHNEYATQTEYNNLKQFVFNGGTIVFTDANILYAEVSYNKTTDSISLVDGHDWTIEGETAHKGLGERWLHDNKEWMGSNFLDIDSDKKLYFKNNPFNYTHTEEQYVTNPKAKILLDYKAYNFTNGYHNETIATYEMNYGKGKVINLGIWGHTLTTNTAFLNYFDKVILPIAFSPIKNETMPTNATTSSIENNLLFCGKSGLSDNFVSQYNLGEEQISPDGKWQNVYTGSGSTGVEVGNGSQVFFLKPGISTATSRTSAALVKSTETFCNSILNVDINTVKQLRQNSPPNPWEAGWIVFRYTDTFHYYWFLVRSDGIELGKKDCDTCSNPADGQQFLVTKDTPTLQLNKWSHWTINIVGNHIKISVNGKLVIDFKDKKMSDKLSSGAIAMYSEDAYVRYDNVQLKSK